MVGDMGESGVHNFRQRLTAMRGGWILQDDEVLGVVQEDSEFELEADPNDIRNHPDGGDAFDFDTGWRGAVADAAAEELEVVGDLNFPEGLLPEGMDANEVPDYEINLKKMIFWNGPHHLTGNYADPYRGRLDIGDGLSGC